MHVLSKTANIYRTPVSGVFRRKDSGFAVCGENPANVSQFVARIRHWLHVSNMPNALTLSLPDGGVRSPLFSGRTASSCRFRSRKRGICRWFTPASDAAKVVLFGEVLKLRWRRPTPT